LPASWRELHDPGLGRRGKRRERRLGGALGPGLRQIKETALSECCAMPRRAEPRAEPCRPSLFPSSSYTELSRRDGGDVGADGRDDCHGTSPAEQARRLGQVNPRVDGDPRRPPPRSRETRPVPMLRLSVSGGWDACTRRRRHFPHRYVATTRYSFGSIATLALEVQQAVDVLGSSPHEASRRSSRPAKPRSQGKSPTRTLRSELCRRPAP